MLRVLLVLGLCGSVAFAAGPPPATRIVKRSSASRTMTSLFGVRVPAWKAAKSSQCARSPSLSPCARPRATAAAGKRRNPGAAPRVGAARRPVVANRIDEVEHRIDLPRQGLRARVLPGDFRHREDVAVGSLDELVVDLLDHAAVSNRAPIKLAPLAEQGQFWHRPHLPDLGYPGPIPVEAPTEAARTRVLQGRPIERLWTDKRTPGATPKPDQIEQRNYLVGFRREEGVYFDTPEGTLRASGLAPRVKTVRTMWSDGRPGEVVWRGAFLKRQLGDAGRFTRRLEASVELAHASPDDEARAHVDALLDEAGVPEHVRARVAPVVRITTKRAAVELVANVAPEGQWPKYEKIGFVAIDAYETEGLGARAGQRSARPTVQFEAELLPNGKALYRKDPRLVDDFLEQLRVAYGGAVSPKPKAWRGLDGLDGRDGRDAD